MENKADIAIPFIKYDAIKQAFEITSEATEFLQLLGNKVGVIAVCGKYRTGKSYLMNKLFLKPA